MKLLDGNGRTVTVREVGEVTYTLHALPGAPIPYHRCEVMSDEEARAVLRRLRAMGFTGRVAETTAEGDRSGEQ